MRFLQKVLIVFVFLQANLSQGVRLPGVPLILRMYKLCKQKTNRLGKFIFQKKISPIMTNPVKFRAPGAVIWGSAGVTLGCVYWAKVGKEKAAQKTVQALPEKDSPEKDPYDYDDNDEKMPSLDAQVAYFQNKVACGSWGELFPALLKIRYLACMRKRLVKIEQETGVSGSGIAWYPFYQKSKAASAWYCRPTKRIYVYDAQAIFPFFHLCAWLRGVIYHEVGHYVFAKQRPELPQVLPWKEQQASEFFAQNFAIALLCKDRDIKALRALEEHYVSESCKPVDGTNPHPSADQMLPIIRNALTEIDKKRAHALSERLSGMRVLRYGDI